MITKNVEAWSDDRSDTRQPRGYVPLPKSMIGTKCQKCGSENLSGVIITERANKADPNIICIASGYWYRS